MQRTLGHYTKALSVTGPITILEYDKKSGNINEKKIKGEELFPVTADRLNFSELYFKCLSDAIETIINKLQPRVKNIKAPGDLRTEIEKSVVAGLYGIRRDNSERVCYMESFAYPDGLMKASGRSVSPDKDKGHLELYLMDFLLYHIDKTIFCEEDTIRLFPKQMMDYAIALMGLFADYTDSNLLKYAQEKDVHDYRRLALEAIKMHLHFHSMRNVFIQAMLGKPITKPSIQDSKDNKESISNVIKQEISKYETMLGQSVAEIDLSIKQAKKSVTEREEAIASIEPQMSYSTHKISGLMSKISNISETPISPDYFNLRQYVELLIMNRKKFDESKETIVKQNEAIAQGILYKNHYVVLLKQMDFLKTYVMPHIDETTGLLDSEHRLSTKFGDAVLELQKFCKENITDAVLKADILKPMEYYLQEWRLSNRKGIQGVFEAIIPGSGFYLFNSSPSAEPLAPGPKLDDDTPTVVSKPGQSPVK